jgi:DNA-binding transcriptional ArsR family regulator
MDEIIMQVARALACRTRLRLLSRLARGQELAPTVLAAELRLKNGLVSAHIRRLVAAGLIRQRRSGVWAYCQSCSAYGPQTFSGQVSAWIFDLLRSPQRILDRCGVIQLCNGQNPEEQVHTLVFETATAFANVRRLQLLRRLTTERVVTPEALSCQLKMSESAVSRHMNKLRRRGYVTGNQTKRTMTYGLKPTLKTPLDEQFFAMVKKEWRRSLQS